MQPHESTSVGKKPAAKNATLRYALSLALLVLIVGGIAWLVQYLPNRGDKKPAQPKQGLKPALEFTQVVAQWGPVKRDDAKIDKSAKDDPKEHPKDVETGESGHYDFLFKNIAGEDVEITHYVNDCDCTSVLACVLPLDEWERAKKAQDDYPAESIAYKSEPAWRGIHASNRKVDADNPEQKNLLVKKDECGVIRVAFVAKKAPGQILRVNPLVFHRLLSDTNRQAYQALGVPVRMQAPLNFYPLRTSDVFLSPGAVAHARFIAWSATRAEVKFSVEAIPPDNRLSVAIQPAKKEDFAALQAMLAKGADAATIKSIYRVTVTLHENKDGQPMEQGGFYRKLHVMLDGRKAETDIAGPEITGRVQSDIDIGGPDDHGRIRFKSFDAKLGSTKTVQLFADAKLELAKYLVHPDWVQVALEEGPTVEGRKQWELTVEVPEGKGERSFNDLDAVLLRVTGATQRTLRIPLEGNIRGGK